VNYINNKYEEQLIGMAYIKNRFRPTPREFRKIIDTWFHGSPEKLDVLLTGSWVTPYKELARAFSHKPSCISASDDFQEVKHNGKLPGYLYIVAEDVQDKDLTLLPDTDETHWQTGRNLKVEMVADVPVIKDELLTKQELEELQVKYPGEGYRSS
jgi:hypothetical protein